MKLQDIILKLEDASNNPKRLMQEYIAQGDKVVGCLPVYTPEELVHAAGMVPMGIWGGNIELNEAKQYFPAFACSIMQSIMENAMKGSYKGLSAAIIPCMCDTLICISQNWKSGIKDIPMIPLVYPQNRKLQSGIDYLVTEFEGVKAKLEGICGHEITEEKINESIEIYNEHRKALQEFIELVPDYLNTITPYIRSTVMKSSHFMKKEEHTALVKELNEILKTMPKEKFKGKKILLTGIILDEKEILDVLSENDMAVAYDNLAHETRQFRTLVPDGDNALQRLAKQWSLIEGCSLAYDPQKYRGKMIAEDAQRLGIDGVIYALMKFCDPEEYDYPIVKKDLEQAGIPELYIEVEQQSVNVEQIRTKIQTFADIIA